jgi:hypothetical protein
MSRTRVPGLNESFSIEVTSTSFVAADTKEAEVDLSLQQLNINSLRDKDVLDWWKIPQTMFPNLRKMAIQFLAPPASSTGVERIFGSSGQIHINKRKSLKEKTLQSLLFMKKKS